MHNSFMQPNVASAPPQGGLRAIIEAARQRARRRRFGLLLLAIAAAVVAALLLFWPRSQVPNEVAQPGPPVVHVPAEATFKGTPYMGIACSTPGAWSCDRIGLFVRLKAPADAVTASLAGRRFALNDLEPTPHFIGRQRNFEGYLEPAGLRQPGPLDVLQPRLGKDKWIAPAEIGFPVKLTIERRDGSIEATRVRIGLAPGWG